MNHRNYAFASDNTAPAAPEILLAIARVNLGSVASYGEDAVTAEMQHALAAAFDRQGFLAGWPTLNGKAANHLSLLAITQPGGIVFCHPHAHILIDDTRLRPRQTWISRRFGCRSSNGAPRCRARRCRRR